MIKNDSFYLLIGRLPRYEDRVHFSSTGCTNDGHEYVVFSSRYSYRTSEAAYCETARLHEIHGAILYSKYMEQVKHTTEICQKVLKMPFELFPNNPLVETMTLYLIREKL